MNLCADSATVFEHVKTYVLFGRVVVFYIEQVRNTSYHDLSFPIDPSDKRGRLRSSWVVLDGLILCPTDWDISVVLVAFIWSMISSFVESDRAYQKKMFDSFLNVQNNFIYMNLYF